MTTIFATGSLGWKRIQADRALARRERIWNVCWAVGIAALVVVGFSMRVAP